MAKRTRRSSPLILPEDRGLVLPGDGGDAPTCPRCGRERALGVREMGFWGGCFEACCPEEECFEVRDDFNREDSSDPGPQWTIVAGDWEINGNRLRATSDGSLILFDESFSSVSIVMDCIRHTTGQSLAAVFDYKDVDNYAYIELGATGALTKDVFNGRHRQVRQSGHFLPSVGTPFTRTWCFENFHIGVGETHLQGVWNSGRVTHDGNRCGIYVPSVDSSYVEFDNFFASSAEPECTPCTGTRPSCSSGDAPLAFDVTLPHLQAGDCAGCNNIGSQTFRLPYQSSLFQPGGVGNVSWFWWVDDCGSDSLALQRAFTGTSVNSVRIYKLSQTSLANPFPWTMMQWLGGNSSLTCRDAEESHGYTTSGSQFCAGNGGGTDRSDYDDAYAVPVF